MDDIGLHLLNPKIPQLSGNLLAPTKDHHQIALAPKFLDGYVGSYRFSHEAPLIVTRKDDQLFVKRDGDLKVAVCPESNLECLAKIWATSSLARQNGPEKRLANLAHASSARATKLRRCC